VGKWSYSFKGSMCQHLQKLHGKLQATISTSDLQIQSHQLKLLEK